MVSYNCNSEYLPLTAQLTAAREASTEMSAITNTEINIL